MCNISTSTVTFNVRARHEWAGQKGVEQLAVVQHLAEKGLLTGSESNFRARMWMEKVMRIAPKGKGVSA